MAKDSTMLVQVRDNEEWLDDSRPLDTRPTAEPRIHRIVSLKSIRSGVASGRFMTGWTTMLPSTPAGPRSRALKSTGSSCRHSRVLCTIVQTTT